MFRIPLFAAALAASLTAGAAALAADRDAPFDSMDGGTLSLSDWKGQPVLIVNTASMCGFSGQFESLQALYDRYRDRGLVVLAVPSDDFNQELGSDAEVKDYCEMTYGIDLPMTTITRVRGAEAHPFYQWARAETGFEPGWNFNKVLLDRDHRIVETFGATAAPDGRRMIAAVESALN